MTHKTVYLYEESNGYFTGAYAAPACPLEKGKYHIPVFSTEIAPPECEDNEYPVFKDGNWTKAIIQQDAPAIVDEAEKARYQRDTLLRQADIEINKLEDVGKDAKAWRKYRQSLRDVPNQKYFPDKIKWLKLPNDTKED